MSKEKGILQSINHIQPRNHTLQNHVTSCWTRIRHDTNHPKYTRIAKTIVCPCPCCSVLIISCHICVHATTKPNMKSANSTNICTLNPDPYHFICVATIRYTSKFTEIIKLPLLYSNVKFLDKGIYQPE